MSQRDKLVMTVLLGIIAILLLLYFLTAGIKASAVPATNAPTLEQLLGKDSRLPDTIKYHQSQRTSASGETLLLHLTWFEAWNVMYDCAVTVKGSEASALVLSLSERKRFYPQWTEAELAALKSALKLLPQPPPQPVLERCVFVSYLDGTDWKSLIYDRASLPPEVLDIYKLAGEPIKPCTAPVPEKTPH